MSIIVKEKNIKNIKNIKNNFILNIFYVNYSFNFLCLKIKFKVQLIFILVAL